MTTSLVAPEALWAAVQGDHFWEQQLEQFTRYSNSNIALHLAILVNPYLELLLSGQKTLESRFSLHRRAPYDQVHPGDIVLFKRSGGPILGIGEVAETFFYRLTSENLRQIRDQFADELCIADPAYWEHHAHASFATLMRLQHVRPIPPISIVKRDQRAWVILQPRTVQPTLLNVPAGDGKFRDGSGSSSLLS